MISEPHPKTSGVDPGDVGPAVLWQTRLGEGTFAFQSCGACGAAVYYPRVLCPACGSTDLRWRASSGLGTIYSTTTVYSRGEPAHLVCLVDLDDGFRMMSTVVDADPDHVAIGQRVRAHIDRANESPRVVFTLDASA
jgi:uncharacterized OB-fold protein